MFYLIAGMGHCGTQWLSAFLDRPDDGMVCTHEEKFRAGVRKGILDGWMASLMEERRSGLGASSKAYVDQMKRRQQEIAVVGDSHSWEPFIILTLAESLPVSKIVFMVRNGIQNVHSMHSHNTHIESGAWFYTEYLNSFAEQLGLKGLDDFGLWCAWWGANVISAHDLEAVAPVQTVRLEDLTRHPMKLIDLTKSLQGMARPSVMEARGHASVEINRKVQGRRDPDYLWSTWTPNQRSTFIDVCGEAMCHYGYSIPDSA